MQNIETDTRVEARRSFLKKVAYAAPAIIVLGTLTAPMSAHASVITVNQQGTFLDKPISLTGHVDSQTNVIQDLTMTSSDSSYSFTTQELQAPTGFVSWLRSLFGF